MTRPPIERPRIHIDFETRSAVDIKLGAYRYAMDLSTEIMCLAWALDDEPVKIWTPQAPDVDLGDVPRGTIEEFAELVADPKIDIWAHNAQFERVIWEYVLANDYDVPCPPLARFVCTATQAAVNGMPRKLEDVAWALGSKAQKTTTGLALIRKLCIPNKVTGEFDFDLSDYRELCLYCAQDVRTEREIAETMRPLTPLELAHWHDSERINDKGIPVDVMLASCAEMYAKEEQEDILLRLAEASGGDVVKARGVKLTQWVYDRLDEEDQVLMHVYKGGEQRLSLDKSVRETLLTEATLADDVRDVIELSDLAQASSTAKFSTMAKAADPEDHRIRGAFIFCGASSTGRFSGRLIQPQNLPRDELKNAEVVRDLIVNDAEPDDIRAASDLGMMQTLKRLVRFALRAEKGKTFVAADWSSIEGRALPWLSQDDRAEEKLCDFEQGIDLYEKMAARIYDCRLDQVTKAQRQVGKVAELALGYGGARGAFGAMARGYGVSVTEEEADRITQVFRAANSWAVDFWNNLERAALQAIGSPGDVTQAGRIRYLYNAAFLKQGALFCLLPSGRMLTYAHPRVEVVTNKWGNEQYQLSALKANFKPKSGAEEWPRVKMWRGLLAENVTQATCADLLVDALAKIANDSEHPDTAIAHVHDEIVLEVLEEHGEMMKEKLCSAMTSASPWAAGLPLAVEAWVGRHYRK